MRLRGTRLDAASYAGFVRAVGNVSDPRMAERALQIEADMRTEAQEILVSAFEKFCGGANPQYDKACEMAKEAMDKKFGGPWNCVMGAGFSFEIQSEAKHILYMFNLGTTALLLWKP